MGTIIGAANTFCCGSSGTCCSTLHTRAVLRGLHTSAHLCGIQLLTTGVLAHLLVSQRPEPVRQRFPLSNNKDSGRFPSVRGGKQGAGCVSQKRLRLPKLSALT